MVAVLPQFLVSGLPQQPRASKVHGQTSSQQGLSAIPPLSHASNDKRDEWPRQSILGESHQACKIQRSIANADVTRRSAFVAAAIEAGLTTSPTYANAVQKVKGAAE